MPTITLESQGVPNLLPMPNRSHGIHVSEIISDISTNVFNIYTPSSKDIWAVDDKGDWLTNEHHRILSWVQMGCALEDAIAHRYNQHYPGRFVQPGELQLDGIFLTPDLWEWEPNIVDEIKLTKYSSRNGPLSDQFFSYERQLMSYCKALSTQVGRLRVCHANGDYSWEKENQGAEYNVWRYEFSQLELNGNWRMLLDHSKSKEFLERTGRV